MEMSGGVMLWIGWLALALAVAGCVYLLAASWVTLRFFRADEVAPRFEAVTLLKPLHGAERHLSANLATFLAQRHNGPLRMLCGIQRRDDPAILVVNALSARHPEVAIDRVVNATAHGANGKIANLINMEPHASNDVLILSDSDIAVAPDYLAQVLAALAVPGTGAVTCLYRGRGDGGFWARLGAAGLSYQFLPGAAFGSATGLARPCMGSTIALRRDTLDAIGGFRAFADTLADDHAIGAAVAALGLKVAVAPVCVVHASTDHSLGDLWRHELRWAATVRDLVPLAYAGSVIGLPLPLALIGALLVPLHGAAFIVVSVALAARFAVVTSVDRATHSRTAQLWMLPLRDCLSFAVFVASFGVRSVDWRGQRLKMGATGRIVAVPEFT